MPPTLRIAQKLIDRIATSPANEVIFGRLYGIFARNSLTILTVVVESLADDVPDLNQCLPAELDVCGVISIDSHSPVDFNSVEDTLKTVDVTDTPVFLHHNVATRCSTAYVYKNGRFEASDLVAISPEEISEQFMYAAIEGQFPLTVELGNDNVTNQIQEAFQQLRQIIASGVIVFNLDGTETYLMANSVGENGGIVGLNDTNPAVGQLVCNEKLIKTSSSLDGPNSPNVIVVRMHRKCTIDPNNEVAHSMSDVFKRHAPVCILKKRTFPTINMVLNISALALLHRDTLVGNLYEIFVESAIKHLRLCEQTLLEVVAIDGDFSYPETYRFFPEILGHFITLIYLRSSSDTVLKQKREQIHKKLILPLKRPLFRRTNKYEVILTVDSRNSKRSSSEARLLRNPHLWLLKGQQKTSSVENSSTSENTSCISMVSGDYLYYHYGQDKLNDKGWGCAYRSLQTIASWYLLQGYTGRPVPSITEIQQCLVEIGDKPATFLNSTQWIGSTEVGFVLDTLLGVTARIRHVASGDEMATVGPELCRHFQWHGSPVMIGGGVLAHTILGVDYSQQTGQIRFLILDPHYTAVDDLKTVVQKGGCAWKPVDFWKKGSYYNMCLPQVPTSV